MEKYAIYLRKSRKDNDLEARGEDTLARHESILRDLAKKQGLPIGMIYREVVSGDSIEARPEMQRLLKDVYGNKWKGVLVVELERLARGDTSDQGTVAKAFKFSETLIVTPMKTYDPNNEFDEEFFEFGLFMSRREYKTIKRRLQAGIKLSVLEGNYLGPVAPMGYDIVVRGRRDRTLKPNEDAKIIQMMFHWYADEKATFSEIARKLAEAGVKTPRETRSWTANSVSKIIKNNIYIGKVRYGTYRDHKEYDPETGKVKTVSRKSATEDMIVADGKHPAIIDMETWNKAVSRHCKNVRVSKGGSLRNPFAGVMRCSECGLAMQYRFYQRGEKVYRWMIHRADYTDGCQCCTAQYTDVMDAVCFALRKEISDFQIKLAHEDDSVMETHNTMIEQMEKNLEKLREKRKKLFRFFEDEVYTEEEFLERKDEINSEIDNLSKNLKEAIDHRPEKIDYSEKIRKFSDVLSALQNDEVSAREKNDLLKEIVEVIYYSRPSPVEPFSLDFHFL